MKPLSCFRCEYPLTGLADAGACPECGLPYGEFFDLKAAMRGARGIGWRVLILQLVAIALGLVLFIFATQWVRHTFGMTDWYLAAMMAAVAVYFAWILGSFFLLPRFAKHLNVRDASFDQRLRLTDDHLVLAQLEGGEPKHKVPWHRISDPTVRPHGKNPNEYELDLRMRLFDSLPFRMRIVYIFFGDEATAEGVRRFIADREGATSRDEEHH